MEFFESLVLVSIFDDAFVFDEVDYSVHEEADNDEPEY